MKNRFLLPGVLLVISLGAVVRIFASLEIRAVDFFSIFSLGLVSGVFIMQIISLLKKHRTSE